MVKFTVWKDVFIKVICVTLCLTMRPGLVKAEDLDLNDKKIEKWVNDWRSSLKSSSNFPIILSSFKLTERKGISVIGDQGYSFEGSYLVYRDALSLNLDARLNKKSLSTLSELVGNPAPPDLVFCMCDGSARVYTLDKSKMAYFDIPKDLGDISKVKNAKDIFSLLGYDAVVLEKKDNLVLVGSGSNFSKAEQIQGLAIAQSESKAFLRQNERKGSGLLEVKGVSGPFAVFEIILLGEGHKDLLPGTKILLQKS